MQSKNYKNNKAFKGLSLCWMILVLWGFKAVAQQTVPTQAATANGAPQQSPPPTVSGQPGQAKPSRKVQAAQNKPDQAPTEAQAAESEQAPADFDLLELRVKGNTLLDPKELGRTVYPFLGPKKTIDTVESARAALEKVYQGKGYQTVAVDIPEQDVKEWGGLSASGGRQGLPLAGG